MDFNNNNIPKLPHAFFKWYCKKERYEELHGDLEEFFHYRVEELGIKKARLYYLWDVIRCFQPYAWKKAKTQNTTVIMLKNYYKTSYRGLMKNPLNSFINLFGLSVAIGICMLVYGFARWTYSIDEFHENKNSVFLTTIFVDRDGVMQQNGLTPRPLGEMLQEDFSQAKAVCRIEDGNVVIKQKDNVFHERVRYTDPEFLDMFTFPLKWGTRESLKDLSSIILSDDMAQKYFGGQNPVGKELKVIFGEHNSKIFEVAGVAEAFPKAHDIDFDFLINFENLKTADRNYDMNDWSEFVNATLIQVDDPASIQAIAQQMDKYKKLQNEVQDDWAIHGFAFEQLATLYERSPDINSDISQGSGSNAKSVVFLTIIAVFMLALACFNYINIAIVSSAKRLKEIGLRKAIGATRSTVIKQFLIENIFLTTLALVIGFLLGALVIIPWFEQINSFSMGFDVLDKNLLIFLPAILLLTGVASGLYPSLYISHFHVVQIFKGGVKFGKKNALTKVFLGFQLVLACILITTAVMFTQNTEYMAKRSWGYNKSETLFAKVPEPTDLEKLQAAMSQQTGVLSVATSADHLGREISTTVVQLPPNQKFEVRQLAVDPDYFNTMGLKLEHGRLFNDHPGSDKQAILVNEVLVNNLRLSDPVGQKVQIDSADYEIIGVLKDFHSYSFARKIEPTLFKVVDEADHAYLSLKVEAGSQHEVYKTLQANWVKLFPEVPFQGGFQEDVWGAYFEENRGHAEFWQIIALIAVLLAALGLYGLVTLNVSGRLQEFSIRKVLGARLSHIATAVTKQYIILFAIALTVGAPISYILVKLLFNSAYRYHMPVTYVGVSVAIIILVSVLVAIVATQVGKVSRANAVEGLRGE